MEKTAVRFDQGKPELYHIHPSVWAEMISGLSPEIQNMSHAMDLWFYAKISISEKFLAQPALKEHFKLMCEVLSFGSKKYAPLNYCKGMKYSRVLNSFRRHIKAEIDGEIDDLESGLPSVGHALCNVLFAITYHTLGFDGTEIDDRV